jgi:hypothetical protein
MNNWTAYPNLLNAGGGGIHEINKNNSSAASDIFQKNF